MTELVKKKKLPQFLDDNPLIRWSWLIALLIFPIFLWILPANFFDEGTTILCPSRFLFDIECYGCGITRAVMHMHHFEFGDAAYFNLLSFVVYPGLIFVWGDWVWKNVKALGLVKSFS